ncbi:MAG: glycosyltransferase family 39 protein [Candidatus Krumholzibacteria bacterium]|nr:glycosyltransferase family 39 protein [Candidatus Krumholzibacteria bacterium]
MAERIKRGKTDKARGDKERRRRPEPKPGFDTIFPLLYTSLYFLVTLGVHLAFFPIGDTGVESDFYGELVVAAQQVWHGSFSIAHYPYKGPFYSFVLVFINFFCGDWYRSGVVLNLLCAAAGLVVLYRLLLRMFDRRVSVFATIAVSLTYEFFLLAHKASSDMLFFLLCCLAIYVLLMHDWSWKRLIGGGVLSALAFLTRYNGIFLPAASLFVLLIVNPCHWALGRRLRAAAVYLVVFLGASVPWFLVSFLETGSFLATRNLQNIVEEFYGGAKAVDIPNGGFGSLGAVVANDPLYFIKHYIFNIPRHLWMDMRHTLGLWSGVLVALGMLRLVAVRPTRRQRAFFVFALFYFLPMCAIFHLPRLSIPLVPAYYALGFSLLFRSGSEKRTRLGRTFGRVFAGRPCWPGRSEEGTADVRPADDRAEVMPGSTDRFVATRLTPGLAVAILVITALCISQIARVVKHERIYYNRRPLFISGAANFLEACARRTGREDVQVVMARKPHIAYYSGLKYQQYPRRFRSSQEFLSFAMNRSVDYVVYSIIESEHYPDIEFLVHLESTPGIEKIYENEGIIVYKLAEWLNINKAAGKATLSNYLYRFWEVEKSNDPTLILEACYDVSGMYAVNGEWEKVARYLLHGLRAAQRLPEQGEMDQHLCLLWLNLSQAYLMLGRHEEGIKMLDENIEVFEHRCGRVRLADASALLARHYVELGQDGAAIRYLNIALDTYTLLGDQHKAGAIKRSIEKIRTGEGRMVRSRL